MASARFLFALAPLLTGCSGCQADSTRGASADDAANHDAGYEAGKDASFPDVSVNDAPADSDTTDAKHEHASPPDGSPVWVPFPNPIAGCAVDRLDNAADLRLFNWQVCDYLLDCEEAVFNPSLIASDARLSSSTRAHDDGAATTLAVGYLSADGLEDGAFVIDASGQVLAGIRSVTNLDERCSVYGGEVWGSRFGLFVAANPKTGSKRLGGLLGDRGATSSLVPFEISPLPAGSLNYTAMGASRWLWQFYPDQLTSFSNTDGSGFLIFAHITDSILQLHLPVATGDRFLFGVTEIPDGGTVEGHIASSDGIEAPKPYITAPADTWVGSPAYANSHVVWARGNHLVGENTFNSVELWASAFSADPTKLQPYKMDQFFAPNLPLNYSAGWGYYVTVGPGDLGPRPRETLIWDIAAKTRRSMLVSDDRQLFVYPGVSRTHLYLVAVRSKDTKARYLMRFALKP